MRVWLGVLALTLAIVLSSSAECPYKKFTDEVNATQYPQLVYQSGIGKDNACAKYQVKNTKDGLFMPVKWTHGKFIFIDCNIPAAPTPWLAVTHTITQSDMGKTSFGYGASKEQYKDKPVAYRPAGEPADGSGEEEQELADKKPKEYHPYNTTIDGIIAVDRKENIRVNLTVSSSYDPRAQECSYTLKVGKIDGKESSPLVFAPRSAGIIPKERLARIVWTSINHSRVKKAQPIGTKLLSSDGPGEKSLSFSLRRVDSNDLRVNKGLLTLEIDKRVICSVTAPAYVPLGD